MSFATFDQLVKTIGHDWLARDDLDLEIKDFIWLAECDAQRALELSITDSIASGTTIPGDNFITLPEDYVRGVRINWTGDDTLPVLDLTTIDVVTRSQKQDRGSPARPSVGAVFGNKLFIGPGPEGSTYDLYYQRGTVHLGREIQTNRLLREYPDVLLHGALVEAGLFLKDPERVQMHMPLYERALTSAKRSESRFKYGPGMLRMRIPGAVF